MFIVAQFIFSSSQSFIDNLVSFFLCLRQRKEELEQRMSALQESRRELMVQLEQLMLLLKVEKFSHPHKLLMIAQF